MLDYPRRSEPSGEFASSVFTLNIGDERYRRGYSGVTGGIGQSTVIFTEGGGWSRRTLRRTSGVKRCLGETLSREAVEVRQEDIEKLREALAEVGIIGFMLW